MARLALIQDSEKADIIHRALRDVHPLLYCEGNPSGIKGALNILGMCAMDVRLPLTSLTEHTMADLKNVMAGINV